MKEFDLLDRKIMYELDINSRITASTLSKKLRKSKETVNFRINRLLDDKYLKGFYTIFNSSKLGWYYYKVYMKFKNITPDKEKKLFEHIQKQKNVAYLAGTEGRYDCIFLVMVKNSVDMLIFMDNFLKLYGEFVLHKDIVTFITTHRLNQRFLHEGKESKDWNYQTNIENYKLDEIEKKILDILSVNARMPLTEIAKKVGVDHKVISYRLKKLEKDKIILAYVTSPNFEKIGLSFFQINITLKDPSVRKEVISFFNSTNKCLFAMELLGKYDVLAELHLENTFELKKIMDEFRTKFADNCNDYDILTINNEYLVVWSPFT